MCKSTIALTLSLLTTSMLPPAVMAQSAPSAITEAEAQSIAVDAYVYFYSLVTMDVTRRQFTNIEPGKEPGKGPMNMFNNVPEYPPASFKGVVRPNFDTLYSIAYLDMTKEPVIVSVPDTNGRYYLLPMLDMWSDVFASPGWRTTGTQAGNFFITPPGWSGTVPDGMTRISAPTPYVWIIGRTKTDGPPDYAAVNKIQAGFKVTLLSEWGKTPKPVAIKIDPSIDMKTPPKVQVYTIGGRVRPIDDIKGLRIRLQQSASHGRDVRGARRKNPSNCPKAAQDALMDWALDAAENHWPSCVASQPLLRRSHRHAYRAHHDAGHLDHVDEGLAEP